MTKTAMELYVESLEREKLERLQKIADEHGLSLEQARYCEQQRIDPGRYAILKDVVTIDDYEAASDSLARQRAARERAALEIETEREKQRLQGGNHAA